MDEWNLLIQEHNKQVEAGYNEGHLSIPDEKPIRLNETDLEKFFRVKDAMLMLWGMIGHAEANQLGGTFSEIKRKYPKLYKTCLVWGWG